MAMRGRPPKAPKVLHTCAMCGSTWEQYEWAIGNRQKYCSRACYTESRVGVPMATRVVPRYRNCKECGKEFRVRREAQYCSRACSAKHRWLHRPGHERADQMTRAERAWLAGLFDGEGCIAWPRRENLHTARIDVYNCNYELLLMVQERTGTGKISARGKAKEHHSQAYVWNCYGDNARLVLGQILPWLIVKKVAAEIVLGLRPATEPLPTQRARSMLRGLDS